MVGPAPGPLRQRLREAAQLILERTPLRPRTALLLGSGHSSIASQLKDRVPISADDLPTGLHLPAPIVIGSIEGVPVALTDAPMLSPDTGHAELTHPVRLLRSLGCELLVVTAGAASLSQQIEPGMIAIVEDHLNLSGIQPLRGDGDEQWGPRFPDMSEPYSHHWIEMAREVALRGGIPCMPGVLAAVPGPSMPTRAEYRFMRQSGADLVSMSMVPEVIAAVHAGFQVLALVGITQQVLTERSTTVSIEAMIEAAEVATPRMGAMLVGVVAHSRDLLE